ncbi:MAG: hypothetical protein ACE5JQ_03710 [Candidatus Methylomirabilales bacterium]
MDGLNLILLFLLLLCIFCLGFGLGIAYQERRASRQSGPAFLEPGDEEVLIFDRVTFGLSRLPHIEDAKALEDAQTKVMREVGEQYGLSAAAVEAAYRRVWHRKHGAQE